MKKYLSHWGSILVLLAVSMVVNEASARRISSNGGTTVRVMRGPIKVNKLTAVASYKTSSRNGIILTRLNSSGDWIDLIYLTNLMGDVNCGFCFYPQDGLKDSLIKIHDKYVEWKKTAEDNHITSMEKTIPIYLPQGGVFHNDIFNEVCHSLSKNVKKMQLTFRVIEGGDIFLICMKLKIYLLVFSFLTGLTAIYVLTVLKNFTH
ncbi:MAG: hypothetical protein IJ544_09265 [Prevotella sp.]|nr:hypothetical protein [Prevotella sp.]